VHSPCHDDENFAMPKEKDIIPEEKLKHKINHKI